MDLLAVTALAFLIGVALAMYIRRRKPPKIPEFDGGFRDCNPPRVRTIIYSNHVHHKDTL